MAVDINQMLTDAANMKAVGQGKSTDKAEDLLGELIQSFNRAFGGFCKILNVGFVNKLLDTGADSGLKSDGYANSMINKGAGSMSNAGGNLYNALSSLINMDFKGVVAGAVEPMQQLTADFQGQHMSYGELGTLTPNVTFGGNMVSKGLSVA